MLQGWTLCEIVGLKVNYLTREMQLGLSNNYA